MKGEKMSIYMTREQLNRINEAGRQGAALREAVHKGIITEEEAFDLTRAEKIFSQDPSCLP